ncbi:electron transfer flavoprotein subunit alpha/FixB family protein [Vibrio gallaecicus]|uniref:Electron transfer flavoprotein subunit alpha/FixB family protein n=1 Tax=Vibrio gallaecicus TaxID=552386 RepID=A0ABV4NDG0_9VIBR
MDNNFCSILIIAEHDNVNLAPETLKTLSAANYLVQQAKLDPAIDQVEVNVAVIGHNLPSVVDAFKGIDGIDNLLVADNEMYRNPLAERMASVIVSLNQQFTHILAPASTFGKNLLPRIAALLDVGQLSDVIEIQALDTVIRPIYAGNALAKVKSFDFTKVMTIRSSAFDAVPINESRDEPVNALTILPIADNTADDNDIYAVSDFVSQHKEESVRPDLPTARIVVSGGRGLGSKENFAMVEKLADKLGAAIGASRAAVDAGYVANDLQVGQTGKIVAPDLYIAVGISGAIQHLAGMKDSKVIVAINHDSEAAIFDVADYGVVGDLFELLPELIDSV